MNNPMSPIKAGEKKPNSPQQIEKKMEDWEKCPKCQSRVIFSDTECECYCSNKKCGYGTPKFILVYKSP